MTLATRGLGARGPQITTVGFGAWAIGGGGWAYGWGAQDDAASVCARSVPLPLMALPSPWRRLGCRRRGRTMMSGPLSSGRDPGGPPSRTRPPQFEMRRGLRRSALSARRSTLGARRSALGEGLDRPAVTSARRHRGRTPHDASLYEEGP